MSPRLAVSLRGVGVRRGDKWVLRGITWRLKPGERWALLGENGAGKTQLLKLLSGDIWPTPTRATIAVRTYWAGRHALELPDAKQRIAYLGAERQDSTPAMPGICACGMWLPPACTGPTCCSRR